MEIKEMVQVSKRKLKLMQEGIALAVRIREFTDEMTEKVAKYVGSREGWNDGEYAEGMHDALEKALKEGDYVSVANYSMFLNGLGYKPGRGK